MDSQVRALSCLIVDAEVKEIAREKIVKLMQAAVEDFSFDVYYPNEETSYRSHQVPTEENPVKILD